MAHNSRHPNEAQSGIVQHGFTIGDDSSTDFDGWAYNVIGSDDFDDLDWGPSRRVIQLLSEPTDIPSSVTPFITNFPHWNQQVNNSIAAYLDENTNSIKLKPMYMQDHVSVNMNQFNWSEINCPDGFVNKIISITPFYFRHQIVVVYEGGSSSSERSGYLALYTIEAKLGEMNSQNDNDRPPGVNFNEKLWDSSTASSEADTPIFPAWTWTLGGGGSSISGRAMCIARERNDGLWVLEYQVLYPDQSGPLAPHHDQFELFNSGEKVLGTINNSFNFLTDDNGTHKRVSFSNNETTIHSRSEEALSGTYTIDNVVSQWGDPFIFQQNESAEISMFAFARGEHTIPAPNSTVIGMQNIDSLRNQTSGISALIFEDGTAFHFRLINDFSGNWEAGYTEQYQLIENADEIISGIFAEHTLATFLVKRENTWYYEAYTSTHDPINNQTIGYLNLFGDIQLWSKENFAYLGHTQGDLPSSSSLQRATAAVALGRYWVFDQDYYGSYALVNGNILFDIKEGSHYYTRVENYVEYICHLFMGGEEALNSADYTWDTLAFVNDVISVLPLDDSTFVLTMWSVEVYTDTSYSDLRVGSFIILKQKEDNPALLEVVDIPGLYDSYEERPWDNVATIVSKDPNGNMWVADGDQFTLNGKVWKLDDNWYPTTSITCVLPDSLDETLVSFNIHPNTGNFLFGAVGTLYEFDDAGNFIEMYRWIDWNGTGWTVDPFASPPADSREAQAAVYLESDTDFIQRIHFDGDFAYIYLEITQNIYHEGGPGIIRINLSASDPSQIIPDNYFARCGPDNFWYGSMGGGGFTTLAGMQETVQPYFGVKQVATVIWVVDRDSGTVKALNASTGDQTNSLSLSETRPWGLSYSAAEQAGSLWLTDDTASKGQQGLSIRSISTGATIRKIPVPGNTPRGIAWSGNRVSIQEVVEEFITLLWIGDGISADHERRTADLETGELGPIMVYEDLSPYIQPTWSALAPDGTFWAWSTRTSPSIERSAFHFDSDFSLIESFVIENLSTWRAMAFTEEGDWWQVGRDGNTGILRWRSTADASTIENYTFTDTLFEGLAWGDGFFWATAYDPDGNGFIHQISEDGVIEKSFQPEGGTDTDFSIGGIAWGGNDTLLYHRYVELESSNFGFFRVSTADGTLQETIELPDVTWIVSPTNTWDTI